MFPPASSIDARTTPTASQRQGTGLPLDFLQDVRRNEMPEGVAQHAPVAVGDKQTKGQRRQESENDAEHGESGIDQHAERVEGIGRSEDQ